MDIYSGMDLQLTIGEALGTDYFGLREPFTPQQEDYLTRTRTFVDTEVRELRGDRIEQLPKTGGVLLMRARIEPLHAFQICR